MSTMQDLVNLARKDLNDGKKVRYTDITLCVFANNYVQQSIQQRPDLYIDRFDNLPEELDLEDDFPIPDRFMRSGADYIIARAHLVNTEANAPDRAGAYLSLAKQEGGV